MDNDILFYMTIFAWVTENKQFVKKKYHGMYCQKNEPQYIV